MYSKICRGKRNNSSTKNEPVGLSHFAQRRPSSSQLKSSFNVTSLFTMLFCIPSATPNVATNVFTSTFVHFVASRKIVIRWHSFFSYETFG